MIEYEKVKSNMEDGNKTMDLVNKTNTNKL